ncbi:MAG: hypothetical protein P8X63_07420 [Desulfuromonadaceae bacterium]
MKKALFMGSVLLLVSLLVGTAVATPDRADRTGKTCGECHSKVGKPLGK